MRFYVNRIRAYFYLAQATRVALERLEEFRDYTQFITEIENHLLVDQMFLVKVHGTNADEYGSYTMVTFYDTRTDKEGRHVDVNQILFDKILRDIDTTSKIQVIVKISIYITFRLSFTVLFLVFYIYTLTILTLQTNQLIELHITHIDEYGKIYAQLNSFMRSLVNSEALSQIFVNNMTTSLARETIHFTKVYFAKWDSQWYRARVKNITKPNEEEVTVFLFDIGKTVTISRRDLFYMSEKVSNALHCIPPQVKTNFCRVSIFDIS